MVPLLGAASLVSALLMMAGIFFQFSGLRALGSSNYALLPQNFSTALWLFAFGFVCSASVTVLGFLSFREALQRIREKGKEMEEARLRTAYSSKLTALGEMAGGIAHEINNPIAIIQMRNSQILELLEEKSLNMPIIQQMSREISQMCSRVANVIYAMKTVSRDSAQEPFAPTDLGKVVENALTLFQERFQREGVEIIYTPLSDNISIYGNQSQLTQVLFNLIGNAFEAIQLNKEQSPRRIEIRVSREFGTARVSVSDSGIGIPEKYRDRLFQPFFSTKPVGRGTGMGLSISHSIVYVHGGKIYLDNSTAQTTFVVELPVEIVKGKVERVA